jgi:D-cysteine desulfhydrase
MLNINNNNNNNNNNTNVTVWIKRDDMTGGIELGGNKIRKLEFLLSDALARGCDSVVTIGGIQSNHCRATAAAARMLNLEPHLLLRVAWRGSTSPPTTSDSDNDDTPDTRKDNNDGDIGFVGNLLVDRMLHCPIYTCTPGEYGRIGSDQLVQRLCHYLSHHHGKRPYPIPVGGSNGIGTWGYIHAVDELLTQWDQLTSDQHDDDDTLSLDAIVFACGSGGTAAGITLGIALSYGARTGSTMPRLYAIGVCDDPAYFYQHIAGIADQMGLHTPTGESSEAFVRQHLTILQGKGLGYAVNTPEELAFVADFARDTGIVVDSVYTGKALYNFFQYMNENHDSFDNANVLFWHTGGTLGLYDKTHDLANVLMDASPCQRLDIYGKGNGIDISTPL